MRCWYGEHWWLVARDANIPMLVKGVVRRATLVIQETTYLRWTQGHHTEDCQHFLL